MPARSAIGLDIGTSVVRAVELSFGRTGITLERFGQVVLPSDDVVRDGEVLDPGPVADCLRQLWQATGLSHKRVVLGVASGKVIVRQVPLPWMEPKELRASLAFQVREILPGEADEFVLDFYPLGESEGDGGARMLNGLLVAAPRETVLANVRCAEQAGLSVQSVDLTSFAVLRALSRQSGPDVSTEALIDIGARVTNIVVHQAGTPGFVRILQNGGQDVTDAVSHHLQVPTPQAEAMKQQIAQAPASEQSDALNDVVETTARDFVDDVTQSLDWYASSTPGARVERIRVTGGGSRLHGLLDRLAAETRIPVQAGDPLSHLRIGQTGLDPAQLEFVRPLAAVPVGLALGAIG